ncbi:hypothetical protein GmHk_14G041393 [Glycine max]|nr:hypothetical protein GmHk_14G041393 [Glycine max]
MSFTISYKKKIVTCPYESLFTFFFLCSPSSAPCSAIAYRAMTVIVPSTAVVVRAVAAAVTVIVIMPFVFYCCCFFLLLLFRELTIEEHGEWCKMAKTMSKVVAPPYAILNTIYGEISMSFAVRWEDILGGL